MSEELQTLLTTSDAKTFAKLFREQQERLGEPLAFLEEAVLFLPARLYEDAYDLGIPHSFFGLLAAFDSQPLFPEQRRWWPLVHQAWFAANETKHPPWPIPREGIWTGDADTSWTAFEEACHQGDFAKALAVAVAFLENPGERGSFVSRLLTLALEDTALGGFKFLYLVQSRKLAKAAGWRQAAKIFFPALHLLVTGPREAELVPQARASAREAARIVQNSGCLTEALAQDLEAALLASGDAPALAVLASAGVGFEGAFEALLTSAAQAIANSHRSRWLDPVRTFLLADAAHRFAAPLSEPEKILALTISAPLIHRSAIRSRENEENRDLQELSRAIGPTDAFSTLHSLVSHSDPYPAASTAASILAMGEDKQRRLFESLALLAAKNDGRQARGYDLLLVKAAADNFFRFQTGRRETLPLACAFFLARLQKSYQAFGAYGVK